MGASPGFAIAEAHDAAAMAACAALFREYQRSLGISLDFQGFDAEVASLPGAYAPPAGRLFLARNSAGAVGCVALRPRHAGACEMKRLFVRPAARGTGLGLALANTAIGAARAIGYRQMWLDTLPTMGPAQRMYERLGFRDAAPYYETPIAGTRFMALDLTAAGS
jgi:ribosomal protein S18 acetylase RimI-like enzyme